MNDTAHMNENRLQNNQTTWFLLWDRDTSILYIASKATSAKPRVMNPQESVISQK